MLSDGLMQWSGISEGGVVLLSTTTSVEDVEEGSSSESVSAVQVPAEDQDLTLVESFGLLAAGLLAGGLFATGLKLFLTPD